MRPSFCRHKRLVCSVRPIVTISLAVSAWAVIGLAQKENPHLPPAALINVPRVVVPDVRGRQARDAEEILRQAGLKPGPTSTSSGPGIVGTVLQQEPQQNSVVPRGTAFNLVLVAPPKRQSPGDSDEGFSRQVPKLSELTPNQASNLLERSRLQLGNISEGVGKGPQGTIYNQKPQAGSWVKVGSRIDVEISEPPKSAGSPGRAEQPIWVFVPNLLGQTQKGAEGILSQYGLRLGGVSTGSAAVPAGTVFAQAPVANTRVVQGSQVRVQVALPGPPPTVKVPDLIHQDVERGKVLLAQTGLQVGVVTHEESKDAPNSIIAQSPDAGTRVQPGASIDLVVAEEIPPVEVPDLSKREEADAVIILRNVGLQMGTVSEHEADVTSGTVLSQKPPAGERVRKGTAVDVVVSRQTPIGLTVMIDHTNPRSSEVLTFHAHLERLRHGVRYRFTFGDGQGTDWQIDSKATHTYKKAGTFQVQAFAQEGDTVVSSEIVSVPISESSWPMDVGLALGVLSLSVGAYLCYGYRLFHKWIRVVPNVDLGTTQLSIETGKGGDQSVCFRMVPDSGEQTVLWSPKPEAGKGEPK